MNINTVTVAGRLTRDVDMRTSQAGGAYARIGMAMNRRTKKGGNWVDEPTFINVMLFGARAEAFAKYHQKGSACCFVNAELAHNSWEDKETGAKRSEIYLVANEWQFVGGKSSGAGESPTALEDEDTPF